MHQTSSYLSTNNFPTGQNPCPYLSLNHLLKQPTDNSTMLSSCYVIIFFSFSFFFLIPRHLKIVTTISVSPICFLYLFLLSVSSLYLLLWFTFLFLFSV